MVLGIVAEFNPFHNGHKYLISEAKRQTGADKVVAVMSGAFVQRGGIAITDKHSRTAAALDGGVDLVLELPVIYSLNTAQKFAYGAVATLSATGVVDTLTFGSECGSTTLLSNAAKKLIEEPQAVSDKIKLFTAEGMSYAAARAKAYDGIIPSDILSNPNDILALEYLRASYMLGTGLDALAIKRIGAAHDCYAVRKSIASAAHIRDILMSGRDAHAYMPDGQFPIYDERLLDTAVISKLRCEGAEYIKKINDVSEGLENRFMKAAINSSNVVDLCKNVKSKRYAMSRIRRIAYSSLIGLTKELAAHEPSYLRVLGMTACGAELLRKMKTAAHLPTVIKAADYKGDIIFDFNTRAENIFALAAPTDELKKGGMDITKPPVIKL